MKDGELDQLRRVFEAAKAWRAGKWRDDWFLTKRERALRDAVDAAVLAVGSGITFGKESKDG